MFSLCFFYTLSAPTPKGEIANQKLPASWRGLGAYIFPFFISFTA